MVATIKRNRLQSAVFVLLVSFSPALFALGLGDAHVRSFLGQPLEVRMDLIARSEAELEGITAGLASAADFQTVGLSRAALSVPLQFRVSPVFPEPYISAFSTLPVNDPVVQFVVEVSFPGGRLLRQYTLFLDPPTFAAPVPMPTVTPRKVVTPPPVPEPAPRTAPARPDVEVTAVPEPAAIVALSSTPGVPETAPEATSPSLPAESPTGSPVPAEAPVEAPAEVPEVPVEPARNPFDVAGPPETPGPEEVEPGDTLTGAAAVETAVTEETGVAEADQAVAPAAEPDRVEEPGAEPEQVEQPAAMPDLAEEPGTEADQVEEPAAGTDQVEEPATGAGPEAAAGTEPGDAAQVPAEAMEEQVTAPAEVEAPAIEPESAPGAIEAPDEQLPEPQPEPQPPVYLEPAYSDATYGPVAAGETMWAIASRYIADTEYSINQAMLAIQRHNPEAFINNNINALKRGAILRMPVMTELGALNKRNAMLEAMRQEEEYRARREGRLVEQPPLVRDEVASEDPESVREVEPVSATGQTDPVGRLELVPPNELGDATETGPGSAGDTGTGRSVEETSAEALARSEEELANARQENEYLNARIRELEEQLARREGTVTDSGLAELEARLREDRQSGAPRTPVTVVAPRAEPAWYTGHGWWLAGVLGLVIAGAAWLLRRYNRPADPGLDTVSVIKEEAEELLRVLADSEPDRAAEPDNVITLERYVETGSGNPAPVAAEDDDSVTPEPVAEVEDMAMDTFEESAESADPAEEEAVELDASDPETKLDLARAYISMGDGEAARAMLREVIEEGNDDQVAEARNMMTEI